MKYFVGSSQVLIEKKSQDRFRVDSITMSIRRKSSETDKKNARNRDKTYSIYSSYHEYTEHSCLVNFCGINITMMTKIVGKNMALCVI